MDIAIQATILTVYVHIHAGVNHRMIKGSIEHALLIGRCLAFHGSEFLVPLLFGSFAKGLKAFPCCFVLKIANGSFGTHGRERHFQGELTRSDVVEIEIGHHIPSGHLGEVVLKVELAPKSFIIRLLTVTIAVTLQGFAQGNGEVGIVAPCPSVRDAITRQQRIVLHTQTGPKRFTVVIVNAMPQVENEARLPAFGISITMNAHTLRGRQLRTNAIVPEQHFIISCRGLLCFMRKA